MNPHDPSDFAHLFHRFLGYPIYFCSMLLPTPSPQWPISPGLFGSMLAAYSKSAMTIWLHARCILPVRDGPSAQDYSAPYSLPTPRYRLETVSLMGQDGEISLDGEYTTCVCTGDVKKASLLPELISDILSRLPMEDVLRFRSVSKEWYALTTDSAFIQMHLKRASCLPRRIFLEAKTNVDLHEEDHGPIASLCLLETVNGMWRGKEIPVANMPGDHFFTLCSCNGLLCVTAKTSVDPLFIYNPIRRECVELPETCIEVESSLISVGFGFDDTTKKYKVVRFFKFRSGDDPCTRGEIITLGEGSWRELELSGRVVSGFNEKPAFSDGAFHWVSEKESQSGCERILVLDIYDEKFQTIRIPSSVIRAFKYPSEARLLNLGGSLLLVEHELWERFCIWRIVRSSETRKDYKFYKSSHSLNFSKAFRNDIFSIKLQDMLIDNKFLFHVRFINLRGREQKKDHLSLYLRKRRVPGC
ncbi:hypothetical protein IFM89_028317 [Coptis chinensis]|uniref:F-box domain-containing protein n=1 Tax=Coptis chinensis TaxID=261450 RepID=A0A835I7Q9_9MAGN|nr:hypothetical protein IFM89_028317 [Coptis chinensis]